MDDPERPEPELPAREAARVRRRERERTAKDRELMRTGQAKAFKQILDAQAKQAAKLAPGAVRGGRRPKQTQDASQGAASDPQPSSG
jgi:hypothetical protein